MMKLEDAMLVVTKSSFRGKLHSKYSAIIPFREISFGC